MDSDNENGLKSLGQDENYFNFFTRVWDDMDKVTIANIAAVSN